MNFVWCRRVREVVGVFLRPVWHKAVNEGTPACHALQPSTGALPIRQSAPLTFCGIFLCIHLSLVDEALRQRGTRRKYGEVAATHLPILGYKKHAIETTIFALHPLMH